MELKIDLTKPPGRVKLWVTFFSLILCAVFVLNVIAYLLPAYDERSPIGYKGVTYNKRQRVLQPRYRRDEWNTSGTPIPCNQKKHILFIKVPKCGSSTLSSIIIRFGFRHGLKTALPLGNKFSLVSLLRSLDKNGHQSDKHDVFASHVRYQVIKEHEHLVPNDAFRTAIIREPLSAFKSFFNYRQKGAAFGLGAKNQLETFFSNSAFYASPDSARFWNRMIRYLGYNMPDNTTQSTPHAVEEARTYVYHVDREFDFVVVLEYFDECLILLKRMLCWETHDMFYTQHKTGSTYSKDYDTAIKKVSDPLVDRRFRELNYADYILYDYFKSKVEKTIAKQDSDFFKELRDFRRVNSRVTQFCQSSTSLEESLEIPSSKWSRGFTMRKTYCRLLNFGVNKYDTFLKNEKFTQYINVGKNSEPRQPRRDKSS
ncbi:galactose-3-O-sulfotransferase 4 [Lingula anatina]|uniref:Galactose-3-O-sulfotransferase 4 n=1 Tax=Lingula anatina TaxID=7574 RepID=A0A1S3IGM0_LINAN|nr:galactose-3-O-sulfotransferase 4 [Lingula anatina]|eukprot:XP_013397410.1 galactose-3-O-sulfotransferase 4 [Lingula anatina]